MKKKPVKIAVITFCALLLVALGIFLYIHSITSSGFNIKEPVYITIDENKNYEVLLEDIKEKAKVESISNFERIASWLGYKGNLKTGRYLVTPDMTAIELVKTLRSGAQTPIKITFNNIRTKEDLAIRISEQLMISENTLLAALNDMQTCESYGFNTETIVAMFIPNTYEFYWDISIDAFLKRMNKEYLKFWNDDRKLKADAVGLSPIQVSTLASIVEEECTFTDEYPTVSELYLNRLRKGQPLQADPTVKFAVGDFSLRRVLNKHLETQSPYNTYRQAGLPPGPIRVPSIKGIESVLNHSSHSYYYMCAKEDFSGRHNFAKTLSEHNSNAAKYRAALNKKQIFK